MPRNAENDATRINISNAIGMNDGPTVVRAAADIERIVDGHRPVLHEEADAAADQPADQHNERDRGSSSRPARGQAVDGIGRVGVHRAIAGLPGQVRGRQHLLGRLEFRHQAVESRTRRSSPLLVRQRARQQAPASRDIEIIGRKRQKQQKRDDEQPERPDVRQNVRNRSVGKCPTTRAGNRDSELVVMSKYRSIHMPASTRTRNDEQHFLVAAKPRNPEQLRGDEHADRA